MNIPKKINVNENKCFLKKEKKKPFPLKKENKKMIECWSCLLSDLTVPVLIFITIIWWSRKRYNNNDNNKSKKLTITFIHPDLGIGGAERLILDAMIACESAGHKPRIVTNFFDPKRCFPDANKMEVIVAGSSFVPRHIAGKGHVLFASVRMFLASIWASFSLTDTDVFVVDQVSLAMVPLRILTPKNVLFYCHFPDQLCDPTRMMGNPNQIVSRSFVRTVYRAIFDSVEAATMHFATRIVCNSNFTLGVTLETFPSLKNAKSLMLNNNNNSNKKKDNTNNSSSKNTDENDQVLYPPVALDALLNEPIDTNEELKKLADNFTIVSINRYERKKNLPLAVEAFAEFKKNSKLIDAKYPPKLVLAGGYDERLPENREHFEELVALAKKLGVSEDVTFLRSISDAMKRQLLRQVASVVVYTPTNEHFGIVPVEAMACRKPVVAVNLGGPLESIGTDKKCGILTDPEAKKFANAFAELYEAGAGRRHEMGENGKQRVTDLFTLGAFSKRLCSILEQLAK